MLRTSSLHDTGTLGAAAREQARVRDHLVGAERSARWRRPRLEPLTALCRTLLLDELSRYRRLGRFPRNVARGTQPMPQFIDQRGTRCAVAHLMEVSGQGELVRHIAKTDNNARLRRLARLPELRAWLSASGLSLDEAARIQPEYCFLSEAEACFCQSGGLTNLALGTVVALEPASVQVRVDRVEGESLGFNVGDRAPLELGSGELGQQVLFTRMLAEDTSVQRVAYDLVVDDGAVRCPLNPETANRPVTVDTVFEALLAERSSCIEVFASDDSAWNRSQCREAEADEGCGVAASAGSSANASSLTSAALFVALLALRRSRKARLLG
jgi:hypothetical protein